MTKGPVCGPLNDSVAKTAELMKSQKIGSIPVTENVQSRKLAGIVTGRDLALKIIAGALDAMAKHQLRGIPVMDNDNKIVGIIAQADAATRVDEPEKTAEMVKEISQANGK
jgi:CBS domain-containing protein